MISGVIFSFILTVICLLFAKPILMLLQVDASIFTMTTEYMRIIFFGLMFTFLNYQCCIKYIWGSILCDSIEGR